MYSNEAKLMLLRARYNMLKERGEVMNAGILAKITRQIRKLEK